MRQLEIRRKDDKPMVIHTKQKTKIHVKGKPEAKIKGRNVLVVTKGLKSREAGEVPDRRRADAMLPGKRNGEKVCRRNVRYEIDSKNCLCDHMEREKMRSVRSDSGYLQQSDKERRAAREKRANLPGAAGKPVVQAALDQAGGRNELYHSHMGMDGSAGPVTENAIQSGKNLYQRRSEQKRKKKGMENTGCKMYGGKNFSETKAWRDGKRSGQKSSPQEPRGSNEQNSLKPGKNMGRKNVSKETSKASATTTEAAVGKTTCSGLERRNRKDFTRNRMIQLFISEIWQEENQDNMVRAWKDITKMRFLLVVKHVVKFAALCLAGMFFAAAALVLPVIAVLAVIYNSPLAIFFPSISSTETTQEVLAAYMAEFDREVETELIRADGYDRSKKVYVDFAGEGIPDNYYDILAVYMVKYGNGDTATDMTDKAKQNLKTVFDDMCSYDITDGTETETDEDGDEVVYTVKYVNIVLKTCQDMILVYNFNTDEQEMLKEMMKPEYLAMLGYEGADEGQGTDSGQYQGIVDAISDANGKKVVEFALSKVGYPYSNALRDSGTHFDCSSLAYYAWHYAGVNISYHGSTTAAYEGKLCHDNNWLVHYDEMQPGDLIFYSYEKNGRFQNISHVAIYTGNGMVVEAANERLGVVYRPVQGKSSIVMIGRPR